MKDMNYFKKNAAERGLCHDYALKWARCKDKESLFKLSLIPQSIPYMATSSYEGWGLTSEYLVSEFDEYINGRYIVQDLDEIKGATGSFYVSEQDTDINEMTSVMHFMNCNNCNINIPIRRCLNMYISNKSCLKINTNIGDLMLHIFDESFVDLGTIKSGITVVVNKYSNKAKIVYSLDGGICNIRNKTLEI